MAHSFAPHMHDFYAVSLTYGGGGAFDCRGEIRYAMPGTSSLIAPGEIHTGHATSGEGWIYRNLYIDTRLMEMLLRALDWRGPMDVRFKSPQVRDPILASRLARAFASLSDSRSLLENESGLLSVVSRLITHHCMPGRALRVPGQEHAAVLKAKDWIDANSEQNVSIHSLAGLAGVSPYYLVRAFHREVGIPPHKYQTIMRVLRARKFLACGDPISEVAVRTGFCDQSHLNRCFKRTLGVTPGRYKPLVV